MQLRLLTLVSISILFPFSLFAQWTNGQNANYVVGQPDFTSDIHALTQNGLEDPEAVAVDIIHHKLYVADGNRNRILRYNLPLTGNQPDAEIVFGQPNFTSNTPNITQNGLEDPRGLWVDHSGRLWVADESNHRVLWYNRAYAITTNQPNADGVLGQPVFTSKGPRLTQDGMNFPCDVTVDETGNLWVTDAQNDRIIRFDNAVLKANGANADAVLGQPDFISNATATTQNGLNDPEGITISEDGTLWVSDDNNNRVLRYDNAAAKSNGANADGVLGQPNFTSFGGQATQNGMNGSSGLTIDCLNNLYVVDKRNERVLVYLDAPNKANGANADYVLGQPNFTSSTPNRSQNGLNFHSTSGLAVWDDYLFISDGVNSRIVAQQATIPLANAGLCKRAIILGPAQDIPTMSEWGLVIFGLLVVNLGVMGVQRMEDI